MLKLSYEAVAIPRLKYLEAEMRVGDMQEIELESSSMDSRRIVSSVSPDLNIKKFVLCIVEVIVYYFYYKATY